MKQFVNLLCVFCTAEESFARGQIQRKFWTSPAPVSLLNPYLAKLSFFVSTFGLVQESFVRHSPDVSVWLAGVSFRVSAFTFRLSVSACKL